MITGDALARELGCTLSDMEDMTGQHYGAVWTPDDPITDEFADEIRAEWSKRTGIDYTKAAQ